MKPIELSGNIHVWTGTGNKIMVSYENTKTLRSFTTIDDAINALFLLGDKRAARELNKLK
jgi:nucleoside-diphosphate-sugar epimerase